MTSSPGKLGSANSTLDPRCCNSNRFTLTNLACSIRRAWDSTTALGLHHRQQWCNRDRNLWDRDRDLVKISRRDRDFIKNSETETETRDLKFETETETLDFKICAFCRNFSKKCRHHFWPWASAGGKRAFPPLEIETKHQDSLENMKLVAQFRSNDKIFAIPLYFPVWHSHCTTVKFTVLVSCSGELAVHSCSLLCVANLGADFFWCWCLLRNNVTAANLQRFASSSDERRFTACCFWTLVPRIIMFRLA